MVSEREKKILSYGGNIGGVVKKEAEDILLTLGGLPKKGEEMKDINKGPPRGNTL